MERTAEPSMVCQMNTKKKGGGAGAPGEAGELLSSDSIMGKQAQTEGCDFLGNLSSSTP